MGTLRYDGAAVSACLRALNIEQCIPWDQVEACDFARFTQGQGILGACCFDSSECSSGYCGDRGPNPEPSTRGRCRAKLGEGSGRCFYDSECEPGLRCSGGICASPIAVGEPCRNSGTPCVEGAHCVGERDDTRCEAAAACAVTCSTIAFRLAHAGWAASKAPMTVTASAFLSFKRANPAVKRSPVRKGFGAASPTRPRARPARTSTTVMRVTTARSAPARGGATRARPAKWRPGPARVSVRRMPTLARPATGVSRVVGVGVVRSTAMT